MWNKKLIVWIKLKTHTHTDDHSSMHWKESKNRIKMFLLFLFYFHYSFDRTSLVTRTVKHLPTMQETGVQSLGQEDPLEKEMAPHSSTLAWKIPWTEEPGGLQSMWSQRVGYDWATSLSLWQRHYLLTYENNSGGFSSSYRTIVLEIPQF